MTESQPGEVSESQIAVHWREEEYIYPPESFIQQANAADPAIFERFDEKNFPDCFTEYAEMLSWDKKWDTVLDSSNPPFWKWFTGGRLNASYNCVDRHLAANANKAAIIWVPEPEDVDPVVITYRELYHRVNEFAALLRDFAGLKARRPGHAAHADGPGTAGDDARLRPARRRALPGVRRVQRQRVRHPDRRLGQPRADHAWTATTAAGPWSITRSRRTRRWTRPASRARKWTRCWSGGGTRASTRRRPRWPRAATSSSTRCWPTTAASWSSRSPCRPRRRCS